MNATKQEATDKLNQLADDAKLYLQQPEEEGTEAQIATENELFRFLQEEIGVDEETCLEACHKATVDERIQWALNIGRSMIAVSDV